MMRCPARVIANYAARSEADVSLAEGSRVIVVGELDYDWFIIKTQSFIFPRTHLNISLTGASAEVTQDYVQRGLEDISLTRSTRVVIINQFDEDWVSIAGRHVPNSTKIFPQAYLSIDMLEDAHQPNVVED